jgi:acyl-coenzyme A thioesterase PaaI-like protein
MSYPQNTISVYTVGAGSSSLNAQTPVVQKRAPSTQDILYRIGQLWVDSVGKSSYQLITLSSSNGLTIATWNLLATNTGPLNTLQGSTGGVIAPIAGNLTIAAGTGMLSTVGTAGTITLNVNFAAPPALGSGTPAAVSATTLTATLGNITATNGNLSLATAGNKLLIAATSSATCSAGTFALSGAATTVISNSAITASSLILLTTQALGTVVVASTLAVTSKIAATSFTVTPSQATDTSTVAYIIIN